MISSIVLFIYGNNPLREVEREHIVPLIARCVAGTAAFIGAITAFAMVPLTIFQVVTQMTPFVAGLLAFLWLGERLSLF